MANPRNGDKNKLVCFVFCLIFFYGKEVGPPEGLAPSSGTKNIAPDTLVRFG